MGEHTEPLQITVLSNPKKKYQLVMPTLNLTPTSRGKAKKTLYPLSVKDGWNDGII